MGKRTARDRTLLVDFVLVVDFVENEAGIGQGNQQQIHNRLRSQNNQDKALVWIGEASVVMRDPTFPYR